MVSRRFLGDLPAGFAALELDLNKARDWQAPQGAIVMSLLPLWVLAENLSHFRDAQTIVALSSTSRYSKHSSSDPKEKELARSLAWAELRIEEWGLRNRVATTILRPTLIYDGKNDQNITRIARFIRRFRILPLAEPASGLRQPIHAEDVAKAIVGAISSTACTGKSFNIAGGEILSYRAMVERIYSALGMKPRLFMLPMRLLRTSFRLATKFGFLKEKHFGFSIFQRMNEDLVFNNTEGLKLLNYNPRKFQPKFK